ncbi:hypothetical protein BHE74_00039767 [Ensete ventricosum]|nr:hypothetical protein BHE74_00039767 [Ensete ventricosum]
MLYRPPMTSLRRGLVVPSGRLKDYRLTRLREEEEARKLLFYLKSEEERPTRLREEEEARKRVKSPVALVCLIDPITSTIIKAKRGIPSSARLLEQACTSIKAESEATGSGAQLNKQGPWAPPANRIRRLEERRDSCSLMGPDLISISPGGGSGGGGGEAVVLQ